jgi:phosphatidate cytidylyltransferase
MADLGACVIVRPMGANLPPVFASLERQAALMVDRTSRWADLGKRVASAIILVPAALGGIWYGGIGYQALVVLAAVGLAVEWVHLCGVRACEPAGLTVLGGVLAAAIGTALDAAFAGLGVLLLAAILACLFSRRISLPLGLPYIGLAAIAMIWMRADPIAGRANLLFLLLIVWASDIGAYLAGRLLGGPRLAPSISPGKTWSGAVGGLTAAIAVGLASAWLLQPPTDFGRVACLAGGLGIIAQAGDLLESRIKRHFGVKDSGRLIPGHGGLLDRLDAVLAAAPVAAVLALVAGPGVVLWQ